MLKKALTVIGVSALTLLPLGTVAQAQPAFSVAACTSAAACIAAVQAFLGPNPTTQQVAAVVAALANSNVPGAAASISAAGALSPSPAQQQLVASIAQSVAAGNEVQTADLTGLGDASAN